MNDCAQADQAYQLGRTMLRENARELAHWAAARLVNRWDARGGYYLREDGSVQRTTRKAGNPYWSETSAALPIHFQANEDPAELVGLHSTSVQNTSKWLAIDIDAHTSEASCRENEECATYIAKTAHEMGFRPLVLGSDGRGGIHLYIFFKSPVQTALVFAFGQDLLRECPATFAPPETFPKQPSVKPGGYGNWIRVFGHHHKLRYISEEWEWETGRWVPLEAKRILEIEGDDGSSLEKYRVVSEVAVAAQPSGGPAAPTEGRLAPATLVFLRDGVAVGQQQNNKLFAAAADLAGNGYTCDDATRWLEDALSRAGELEDPAKVRGTIERAFAEERTPAMPAPGGIDIEIPYPEREQAAPEPEPPAAEPGGGGANNDGRSICNATAVGDGRHRTLMVKTADEIADRIFELKDGFPKSVGGLLFAIKPGGGQEALPTKKDIFYLDSVDKLFGWLRSGCDVMWYSPAAEGMDPATETPCNPLKPGELFSILPMRADSVERIEVLPHYPRREGTFYLPSRLPPPNQPVLDELISRFNAETEQDRELLTAMLMTPGWGGGPGERPAFLLTSDHGRGVGKTITAQFVAEIWGGLVTVDQKETWESARKRLVCDDALPKRVVLVDNLVTRGSGSGLVEAITTGVIDGWRPYYGQFSRPNYLTWIFTANVPSVSQDLVERAITIKIGPQQHKTAFAGWVTNYIREHRAELISSLLARLAGPGRDEISGPYADRWASWQAGVLQKVSGGDGLVRTYTDRREAVDSDLEEGEEMLGALREAIQVQFYKPDSVRLEFDGLTLAHILKDAGLVRRGLQMRWVSRVVNNARSCDRELGGCLKPHKKNGLRLWWWNGPATCEEDARVTFRYRSVE